MTPYETIRRRNRKAARNAWTNVLHVSCERYRTWRVMPRKDKGLLTWFDEA